MSELKAQTSRSFSEESNLDVYTISGYRAGVGIKGGGGGGRGAREMAKTRWSKIDR